MSSKDSFNLFDSSAHRAKKSPPPSSKPPIQAKLTVEDRDSRRAKIFQDPLVKEAVQKIETLHKEIHQKYNELMEKGGHTPRSIRNYLNNPKNFTPLEWAQIQDQRESLEKSISLGLDPKLRELKKSKESLSQNKERRGKTLGGRKKWIDMH